MSLSVSGDPLWGCEQIAGSGHMASRQDRCHDAKYALASLIHGGIISSSCFVRLIFEEPENCCGVDVSAF